MIIIAAAIARIYWYRHPIEKRFIKNFLPALIVGLLYGFIAIIIDYRTIPYLNDTFFDQNHAVHFFISLDLANRLLIELIGYIVLIYGFFSAFLIYIISDIPKFSDEEYDNYKKVILKKMNLFAWITGFVVDFLFFSLLSIHSLESQKHNSATFTDIPACMSAFALFFIIIITLLGYLVFSFVVGMLQVRTEK